MSCFLGEEVLAPLAVFAILDCDSERVDRKSFVEINVSVLSFDSPAGLNRISTAASAASSRSFL